jgi:predicted HD phosphohydrolase
MVFDESTFGTLLDFLENTKGIKAREDYHPEKDVMEHQLQCFHHALRETYDMELVVAALIHDVGKAIEHIGHEEIGAGMIINHVSPKVHFLVLNHTRIRYYYEGKIVKLQKANELVNHPFFKELCMLTRFDKLGRNKHKTTKYSREGVLTALNKQVELKYKQYKEL